MDYVFFAFSAMCFGLAIWIALQAFARADKRPRLWWLLLAGCSAAFYYALQISIFQNSETILYLANILPQVLLLIGLGFLLRRRTR